MKSADQGIIFRHTNLIARDWRRLADFYIRVFGCRLVPPERDLSGKWLTSATGIDNAHMRGVHLLLPGHGERGPTLEIFQYDKNVDAAVPAANREGFCHIAFEVTDVEKILALVEEEGGNCLGEMVQNNVPGVGHLTFVYALDPEDNIIELQNWQK